TLDAIILRSGTKLVLYVNYNPLNTAALRSRSAIHVSLLHGDSDKVVSVSNQIKAYDYSFVAGQAAIDRLARYTTLFDAPARCIQLAAHPRRRGRALPGRGRARRDLPPAPADGGARGGARGGRSAAARAGVRLRRRGQHGAVAAAGLRRRGPHALRRLRRRRGLAGHGPAADHHPPRGPALTGCGDRAAEHVPAPVGRGGAGRRGARPRADRARPAPGGAPRADRVLPRGHHARSLPRALPRS